MSTTTQLPWSSAVDMVVVHSAGTQSKSVAPLALLNSCFLVSINYPHTPTTSPTPAHTKASPEHT